MPRERDTYQRDFLPVPPEQMTLTTGADEIAKIAEARKIFFDEVLDYLGLAKRARGAFCHVHSHALSVMDYEKEFSPLESGYMNARVEYVSILFAGDYAVASCLQLRDDHNYNQASFAHYLTPETEENVRNQFRYFNGERVES
jgi:hypothetical protein